MAKRKYLGNFTFGRDATVIAPGVPFDLWCQISRLFGIQLQKYLKLVLEDQMILFRKRNDHFYSSTSSYVSFSIWKVASRFARRR